jgi:hypothetical protein
LVRLRIPDSNINIDGAFRHSPLLLTSPRILRTAFITSLSLRVQGFESSWVQVFNCQSMISS